MYKLENLPFNYQDLEPFIDTHTIGLIIKNINKIIWTT